MLFFLLVLNGEVGDNLPIESLNSLTGNVMSNINKVTKYLFYNDKY